MKTTKRLLILGLWLLAVHFDSVRAQSPLLGVNIYAGVSITGAVSSVYAVQISTNLTQTKGWTCVALVQLPATNYLWVDTTSPATGQRFYRAVLTAPANMVFIPAGTFRMGSHTNEVGRSADEGPQTVVTLTSGFFMAQDLVTQSNYVALMGFNPSHFTTDTNDPVDSETWIQATNYCAIRTQRELAAGLIPAGTEYRLPTEAEWEYACRAWTSTQFFYGDDPGYTNLTSYAWYSANSGGSTSDKLEAQRVLQAYNETESQPHFNLSLARVYLNGADPKLATRTWQEVMDHLVAKKKYDTRLRWDTAIKDKNFDSIRHLCVAETRPEHFDRALADGKVSSNVFLRRIHNHALGMEWLLKSVIPRPQWPKPVFKEKRAITAEEHAAIILRELNSERRDFYELLWHTGAAQSDGSCLRAEDINWEARTICFTRKKLKSRGTSVKPSLFRFSAEVEVLLKRLPALGQLFPYRTVTIP